MFKVEDFELPLEGQLKLRVFNDEIDNCTDIEEIKKNLKQMCGLLMNYQHILNRILREQIEKDLTDFSDVIKETLD
tara:strand:+ start:757 stop:984 length:228 start_codon:yes stop_codon:yes gene_type:complete